MKPYEYFTFEKIMSRSPERVPEVLFHWTRSLELGEMILADGVLIGRPTVSTSENPAFGTPGPVVFVISPAAVVREGFTLWPYLWQKGAEREAEWVIASGDAEFVDRRHGMILSKPVRVPLKGVVEMVGYPPSWEGRREEGIKTLREAAERRGIPVRAFDWEEWWQDGLVVP